MYRKICSSQGCMSNNLKLEICYRSTGYLSIDFLKRNSVGKRFFFPTLTTKKKKNCYNCKVANEKIVINQLSCS